jgi:hypothetical protein
MTLLFATDTVRWSVERSIPTPAVVQVTTEGIESCQDLTDGADTVRLVLEICDLSWGGEDEAADITDLVDRFAEIDGVVPPEWVDDDGTITIPLVDPDDPGERQLRWHIRDDVWLVHAGRLTAYFEAPEADLAAGALRLGFTHAEARRAMQVFASVEQWQRDLLALFARLADDRRAAFLDRRELEAVTET